MHASIKIFKGILRCLTLFSFGLCADLCLAKEPALLQKVLPNAHADLSVYHQVKALAAEKSTGKTGTRCALQAKFWQEKLDTILQLGVDKKSDMAKFNFSPLKLRVTTNVISYNDKSLALDPYIKTTFPLQADQAASHGRCGAIVSSHYQAPTAGGSYGLRGYYDLAAKFSHKPAEVQVSEGGRPLTAAERPRLNLSENAEGEYEVAPQSLASHQVLGIVLTYAPTRYIAGFSVECATRRKIQGTPIMEYLAEESVVKAKTNALGLQSYRYSGETSHRLGLHYRFNEIWSLKNDFSFAASSGFSYENKLVFAANLF